MRKLRYQFELIRAIRNFFEQDDFLDVLTPPMVENPGMEPHIHPFQIYHKKSKELSNYYLHTSPEFHMKNLLSSSEDFEKIFTINYCFRDEPTSQIHRNQFLMLEWYRKNAHYSQIMDDTENLIKFCHKELSHKNIPVKKEITEFPRVTVQDLFLDKLKFDILDFLNSDDLRLKIQKDFKDIILPNSECSWDDYFFLLFLNKIEPDLIHHPYLLICEYPTPLAALSTLKADDPRVCERFEVYLNGIELCNCFNELTNYREQVKRFEKDQKIKEDLYGYTLPWPSEFLASLKKGLPSSSGIALGVERLLMSLVENIQPFFTEENS